MNKLFTPKQLTRWLRGTIRQAEKKAGLKRGDLAKAFARKAVR